MKNLMSSFIIIVLAIMPCFSTRAEKTILGYGTSHYAASVALKNKDLPAGCHFVKKSILPWEHSASANLAIDCGKNGDFILGLKFAKKKTAARSAAIELMIHESYDLAHTYKRDWHKRMVIFNFDCEKAGKACYFNHAHMCPWVIDKTTSFECAGMTATISIPTPPDPKMDGMSSVGVVSGAWPLARDEQARRIFAHLKKMARWQILKDF